MSASRIGNEDTLQVQGDRDGLVMAHTDCAQWIANHHQDGIVSSHPTQEVILPFACEAAFSCKLVFGAGDYLLYQMLVATGNPNPHQMMIILRLTFKSFEKASNTGWQQAVVTQATMGAPVPENGPGAAVFGGVPLGGGQNNNANNAPQQGNAGVGGGGGAPGINGIAGGGA
jgi:hypothetical protein